MEYKLRGWVEKELERITQPESIRKIVRLSRRFMIKHVEQFCFAYIVGAISHGSQAQTLLYYKREMTYEEWNEGMEILEQKTLQIREKIRLGLIP